jgi:hypothetical protein
MLVRGSLRSSSLMATLCVDAGIETNLCRNNVYKSLRAYKTKNLQLRVEKRTAPGDNSRAESFQAKPISSAKSETKYVKFLLRLYAQFHEFSEPHGTMRFCFSCKIRLGNRTGARSALLSKAVTP